MSCDFHENRYGDSRAVLMGMNLYGDSRAVLMGMNEILLLLSTFFVPIL
jgi:hypothetical protein